MLSSVFAWDVQVLAVTIGMQRVCLPCESLFSVCRPCWREQWYCSPLCGLQGKRRSRSRANRKYRSTMGGKVAQRSSQKAYRQRARLKLSVRDHSSTKSAAYLSPGDANKGEQEVEAVCVKGHCICCGRKITHWCEGRRFPRRRRQRRRVVQDDFNRIPRYD